MSEPDYRRAVTAVPETRLLPGTRIEIILDVELSAPPDHVLFDFDGTLSLIREGWPEVMVPMMVEVLRDTGTHESEQELGEIAADFVMALAGKQTIYQMIRLADEVARRGGHAEDPLHYKQVYHDRLMRRVGARREDLRAGRVAPETMLVPGSTAMLQALRDRGAQLYLASGTDEEFVREEADLLGLTPYFGERLHGALDDYRSFSKAQVIQRMFEEREIDGARLLGFGDGYVEIDNVKSAGGIAVAVASDEAGRSGEADAWKRERLIGVGADIVIPDFQDWQPLVDYLWRDA
jgi:phosphoglycolate phosphatase-like HAD superfamily hydrolase